jgi:hypothetical protein
MSVDVTTISALEEAEIAHLVALPYEKYLESEHWQKVRAWMLDFAGNRCQLCCKKTALEVHHNNYYCLGRETRLDLAVLCSFHHGQLRLKKAPPPPRRKKRKKRKKSKWGRWRP